MLSFRTALVNVAGHGTPRIGSPTTEGRPAGLLRRPVLARPALVHRRRDRRARGRRRGDDGPPRPGWPLSAGTTRWTGRRRSRSSTTRATPATRPSGSPARARSPASAPRRSSPPSWRAAHRWRPDPALRRRGGRRLGPGLGSPWSSTSWSCPPTGCPPCIGCLPAWAGREGGPQSAGGGRPGAGAAGAAGAEGAVLALARSGCRGCACTTGTAPDGACGGSPHVHLVCTEAYVVAAGAGAVQTLGGDGYLETPLRPDDVVWFAPGTVHRLINHGGLRDLRADERGLPRPATSCSRSRLRSSPTLTPSWRRWRRRTACSPPGRAPRRRRDLAVEASAGCGCSPRARGRWTTSRRGAAAGGAQARRLGAALARRRGGGRRAHRGAARRAAPGRRRPPARGDHPVQPPHGGRALRDVRLPQPLRPGARRPAGRLPRRRPARGSGRLDRGMPRPYCFGIHLGYFRKF